MNVVIGSNGNIVNLAALSHIEIQKPPGLASESGYQVVATTINGRQVLLGDKFEDRAVAAKSFKLRAVTKPLRDPVQDES